jgi:hypothetical protein
MYPVLISSAVPLTLAEFFFILLSTSRQIPSSYLDQATPLPSRSSRINLPFCGPAL